MNSRKLVSAALTVTTVLWMVGAAALLPVASAQTTASLQAQIASLLAEIQTLQGQLNASGTTTSSTGSTTYDFTSNLTVGSTGSAVTALQTFLIGQGDLVLATPTQYFGAKTQAALAKFQAANGITPSVGYFGPKTRAFVNSLSTHTSTTTTTTTSLPAGCTTSAGYSSTTGASCSTGMTSVVAPSTGLAVSLASTNPAAGSLISSSGSGSGRIPVLAFNLTAGNSGAVTVSALNFQQTGVLAESAISGAYLTQNGQVVAQYSSLNNQILTFSGLALSIPAGQTVTLDLDISVAQGLSAGNTTAFTLPSASDVTAFDTNNNEVTATGSFPLNSNIFTVTTVSNPSLAYVTIASSSIGTSVTAGTQGNIVGAWTFNVSNDPVWLQNLNFHVIGSANVANIQNVKLLVNGTQVGATLSSVPANGMADFNATSSNIELNTGSNNVQIVANIMGSPSDNFQFEILNNYDVLAIDSQYNVPVSVSNSGGDGTQVSIQTGTITLDQDANTPTGNIAEGTSNTVLAKYDLYAAGEPVKVQWLDFQIDLNGLAYINNTTDTLASQIQNVQIVDDAGNQVGTTINTPPSSQTCTPTVANPSTGWTGGGSNAASGHATNTDVVYGDCFGSSGSPINYIVPANTTRVLSLEANIQSTADFQTITANLVGDTGNLQGMVSSQSGNTSGVNGVALTLVSSSLTATQNNAIGAQNVSAGTTDLEIGSYALGASSAGGVNVNTVSIVLAPGQSSSPAAFQNLKVMVNGTQFGSTDGTVTNGNTYSFSGAAFNVPAGQTVDLNVYADTMSSATGTFTPATSLSGFTGVGQTSYTSVSLSGANVVGQALSFNGHPALTIAADSSNPPVGQIVQNLSLSKLAVYRFTETSNVENVKVTQLDVADFVSTSTASSSYDGYALPAFNDVSLWNGSQELGTAASPVWVATTTNPATNANSGEYDYDFTSFSEPLIVPQGNSVSLTLEGNAGSYTNGSITDNSTQQFEIASSSTIDAMGATSNKTASTTLSNAYGNQQTVLRSTLAVSANPVMTLPPAAEEQIGSITLASNPSGDNVLNNLVLTFGGAAASTTNSNFLSTSTLILKDSNGGNIVTDGFATSSIDNSGPVTETWYFLPGKALDITAGSSYTLTLWADLSAIPATENTSQSLTASINGPDDLTYADGTQNPSSINLTTNEVPITVASLQTGSGGVF